MRPIRVGTRGSRLAILQTNLVVSQIQSLDRSLQLEVVVITTTGDTRSNVPFAQVGEKGMFVKEIEEALLGGAIDLGVHSLKDMPSELPDGLVLAATPAREDPRDALLSNGLDLAGLQPDMVVGTSSLRRQAQIRAHRPDLRVEELRGNLDTRLRKLDDGGYDAIVLACAGLDRMGLGERITERLPVSISVPAPGQGALALEVRKADAELLDMLRGIDDPDTRDAVAAERAFQAELQAGCAVPAGALAEIRGDRLTLHAMIGAPDGSEILRAREETSRVRGAEAGARVARELRSRGGDRYLGPGR